MTLSGVHQHDQIKPFFSLNFSGAYILGVRSRGTGHCDNYKLVVCGSFRVSCIMGGGTCNRAFAEKFSVVLSMLVKLIINVLFVIMAVYKDVYAA